MNLQTGVMFDSPPLFKSFGQVLSDAAPSYRTGVTTWKAAGPGTYRIVRRGDAKAVNGTITPFTGTSRTFTVTQ